MATGLIDSHNRVASVVSSLDVVSARPFSNATYMDGYYRRRSRAGLTAARAQSCASGARMSVSFPFYRVAVVSKERSREQQHCAGKSYAFVACRVAIVMLAHRDIGRNAAAKGSGTNPIGRQAVEESRSAPVYHD